MHSLAPQRNLWTLRLYYFSVIGGSGFLFPFINLFYTRQGLSGTFHQFEPVFLAQLGAGETIIG